MQHAGGNVGCKALWLLNKAREQDIISRCSRTHMTFKCYRDSYRKSKRSRAIDRKCARIPHLVSFPFRAALRVGSSSNATLLCCCVLLRDVVVLQNFKFHPRLLFSCSTLDCFRLTLFTCLLISSAAGFLFRFWSNN